MAAPARAQSWKSAYPELVLAVVPAENASGVSDRYAPFTAYLSKQLGTKVTLRIANDYAAVIEGQRAGNVHIGYYGPASFARALVTGVKTTAFVIDVNNDGSKGYYSVFYVKADSPYQSIEDLKGKNLGLVDPNSTSGYNMPLFALDKRHINAEKFFDKVLVTGSHENAVLSAGAGHGADLRQLVERAGGQQPDAHARQSHGQGRRRQAGEGERLPDHPEVGPDHQLADRLSGQPAERAEDGDPPSVSRRAEERQGGVRPAFGRQEPALGSRSRTPRTTTPSS